MLLIWDSVFNPSGIASIGELPKAEQLAAKTESIAEVSWREDPTPAPQLPGRKALEGSVSVTADRSRATATPVASAPKAVEPAGLHPSVPAIGEVGMTLCSDGCDAVTKPAETESITTTVTLGQLSQSVSAPIGVQE
jgi:hypothetical protein